MVIFCKLQKNLIEFPISTFTDEEEVGGGDEKDKMVDIKKTGPIETVPKKMGRPVSRSVILDHSTTLAEIDAIIFDQSKM